jgi:hypothetical protein
MGKSGSAPESPNPNVVIPMQGAENRKTFDYQLAGMRTNTQGPSGSQTWSQTPTFDEAAFNKAMQDWQGLQTSKGGPDGVWSNGPSAPSERDFTTNSWTLNTLLSPEQQALYDANTQSQLGQANLLDSLTGRVADSTSQPIDWSGLDQNPLSAQGANDQMSDTLYRMNTRYLDPQMGDSRRALEGRLADQGFVPGTPAYAQAMDQFSQGSERAYADARDRATAGSVSAGSQLFNQRLQGRAQQLAEILQRRNQPLNELNALRMGTQVSMPQGQTSSATPNLPPTDIMGMFNQNYQNQLGGYNTGVAGDNATQSALSSLAMAAAMFFSDARLKDILALAGSTRKGVPLYTFRYKGFPKVYIGVIAQEAREIVPEAVHEHSSGYLMVDYSKV